MGRRWFMAGLVLLFLFGLGHLLGFLGAVEAARNHPSMADLTRMMRAHKTEVLGMQPSLLDFREYSSLNFTLLLWLGAALGAAGLKAAPEKSTAVRHLAPVYVVGMLLLAGTSYYYSVAQGIIASALIALLFAVAWWRA